MGYGLYFSAVLLELSATNITDTDKIILDFAQGKLNIVAAKSMLEEYGVHLTNSELKSILGGKGIGKTIAKLNFVAELRDSLKAIKELVAQRNCKIGVNIGDAQYMKAYQLISRVIPNGTCITKLPLNSSHDQDSYLHLRNAGASGRIIILGHPESDILRASDVICLPYLKDNLQAILKDSCLILK